MWWMALLVLALSTPTSGAAAALRYPPTPRDSVVDDYHGTKIADPYRWLEDLDNGRTQEWVKGQNRFTRRAPRRRSGPGLDPQPADRARELRAHRRALA
jgi:hypothetical protein